jgi:hypothetical protein
MSSLSCPRHSPDYKDLLSTARVESGTNITSFLHAHLPSTWRDLYVAAIARPTNIVRFRSGSFEYLYDLYSELEASGEVPYDQTVENRVVAVFGTSASADKSLGPRRTRGWLGMGEDLLGANRDKGHFIAHSIGGRFDVNVFSQDRDLNRGWSAQGKLYRQMERYCQEHPGTF